MPFNFITLWKSEMKLKSFINCKSTYILSHTSPAFEMMSSSVLYVFQ